MKIKIWCTIFAFFLFHLGVAFADEYVKSPHRSTYSKIDEEDDGFEGKETADLILSESPKVNKYNSLKYRTSPYLVISGGFSGLVINASNSPVPLAVGNIFSNVNGQASVAVGLNFRVVRVFTVGAEIIGRFFGGEITIGQGGTSTTSLMMNSYQVFGGQLKLSFTLDPKARTEVAGLVGVGGVSTQMFNSTNNYNWVNFAIIYGVSLSIQIPNTKSSIVARFLGFNLPQMAQVPTRFSEAHLSLSSYSAEIGIYTVF